MQRSLSYNAKDRLIEGSLIHLADHEMVWNALEKGVRTSIRKGEQMGVTIRAYDGTKEELAILAAFTPNDDDIPATWEDRHHAYVAVANDTKECLGWILLAGVPGTKKVFMLCHASTQEGKRRQTPNMLLWHAVKTWAGKEEYQWFDVGASYRATLQNYFSHFRQHEYPMVMKPAEYPIDLRVTPFDTTSFGIPAGDPDVGRKILTEQFGTDQFTVFPRAMYAIAAVLREYRDQGKLTADDEVLVATTTDTPYVSSCVSSAIEAVCKWSQTPSDKTKAVFMIHEFGFPNPRAAEWRKFCDERGIPLIEDLAYGWGSEGTGTWGDVRIYSATKLMPLQFGGFLVGMKVSDERMWHVHGASDKGKENEVLGMLAAHWQPLEEIRVARQKIWQRYANNLASIAEPYFELSPGVIPGAFILKMKDEDEMKRVASFVRRFGIEVGNWYHHSAIFLPCHQRMTDRHVDYVCGAILANYRENCGIPHE